MRRVAVAMLALLGSAGAVHAAGHDTHPLIPAETRLFIPLLCEQPTRLRIDGEYHCRHVTGYPGADAPSPRDTTLTLDAIAYGSFTAAAADEAYISYSSSLEPHANNFGGGVLMARAQGRWALAAWYPGKQMSDCLALPGDGPQAMLCLAGYTGMGEIDSSLWIERVAPLTAEPVLKAQDLRHAGLRGEPVHPGCRQAATQAVLLEIAGLRRSLTPGAFAVARVTYALPKDVRAACQHRHFERVRPTTGRAILIIEDGKIRVVAPVEFAEIDD